MKPGVATRAGLWLAALLTSGCAAIPDIAHEPQIHNPFPQLARVAILPFFNQSKDPTLDQDRVALAYYNELQQIPGFEVMPIGVVKQLRRPSKFDGEKPVRDRLIGQY